jgi:hypothetical protein
MPFAATHSGDAIDMDTYQALSTYAEEEIAASP